MTLMFRPDEPGDGCVQDPAFLSQRRLNEADRPAFIAHDPVQPSLVPALRFRRLSQIARSQVGQRRGPSPDQDVQGRGRQDADHLDGVLDSERLKDDALARQPN